MEQQLWPNAIRLASNRRWNFAVPDRSARQVECLGIRVRVHANCARAATPGKLERVHDQCTSYPLAHETRRDPDVAELPGLPAFHQGVAPDQLAVDSAHVESRRSHRIFDGWKMAFNSLLGSVLRTQ